MKNDFKNQMQQHPANDPEYNICLRAWLVYHKTADAIDGHILSPTTAEERELCNRAGREALAAQKDFLSKCSIDRLELNAKKWQSAKMESIRIIESGRGSHNGTAK